MEALMLDVKNYDAFRELVEGGMMSATEGIFTLSRINPWLTTIRMVLCSKSCLSVPALRR